MHLHQLVSVGAQRARYGGGVVAGASHGARQRHHFGTLHVEGERNRENESEDRVHRVDLIRGFKKSMVIAAMEAKWGS